MNKATQLLLVHKAFIDQIGSSNVSMQSPQMRRINLLSWSERSREINGVHDDGDDDDDYLTISNSSSKASVFE
jgi:hypothetical protein